MNPYLLDPKVRQADLKMLTQVQLMRLLRDLKGRKFKAKDFAVDVEEINTTERVAINVFGKYGRIKQYLPPGSYFNVHVEWI